MQHAMDLVVRKGVGTYLGAAMHLWVVLVLAPVWYQHGGRWARNGCSWLK